MNKKSFVSLCFWGFWYTRFMYARDAMQVTVSEAGFSLRFNSLAGPLSPAGSVDWGRFDDDIWPERIGVA
jgi:hypothetical protein